MTDNAETLTRQWLRLQPRLLTFVRRRVASDADAEDILGAAVEKWLRQVSEGVSPENDLAWFYRVLRNAIVDYYRGQRDTHPHMEEHASQESEVSPVTDSDDNAWAELVKCVQPLLGQLPPGYRHTLYHAEINGLPHRQVANITGKSLAATKADVRRGRQMLRELLVRCCHAVVVPAVSECCAGCCA